MTRVRSSTWLRALAIVLGLFALGHTLGTASPKVTRGARESIVFMAMQGFRFPMMGFERSHWDFYRGFAITVSVTMAVMAAVSWQLARIAQRSPREALPMAVTLLLGSVGLLVLCWAFFFTPPVVFSAVAVACASMAVVRLRGEGRREPAV
ncbi:MAG: LIC_13387 family protein [Gemmatimonadaceae bacterium]